jgi:hypothetical protein
MHLRFWVLWVSILVVFTLSMAAFFSNVKGHNTAAIGCGISSFILSCFCIGVWYFKGDTFDGSSLLSMKNRMEKKGRSFGDRVLFRNKKTIQKNYTKRIQTKRGAIATAEHQENQANSMAQEYRRQAQNEKNPTLAKQLRQTADHHEREAYKHKRNKEAHQTDLEQDISMNPRLHEQFNSSATAVPATAVPAAPATSGAAVAAATPARAAPPAPPAQTREDTMQTLNHIHSMINDLNTIQNNDPQLITIMQTLYNTIKQCNPQDNVTREYLTNYKHTFNTLLKMHINVQTHAKNYQNVKQLEELQPFQ